MAYRTAMLNFRKLRQDFSPAILKDGKALFEKGTIVSAKILQLKSDSVRLSSQVLGSYDNCYECELEIDRQESEVIDSNCDCPYTYDCQHLAALLFYLETHFDEILVAYSKDADLDSSDVVDTEEKEEIEATIQAARTKEVKRRSAQARRELLEEYVGASDVLGGSPFFLPEERLEVDKAELAVIFSSNAQEVFDHSNSPEIQLSLRLPFRSKPLHIPNIQDFVDAVRYREPIYLGGRRYFFTLESFGGTCRRALQTILEHARFPDGKGERNQRVAQIDAEAFGVLLADLHSHQSAASGRGGGEIGASIPGFYCGGLEQPLLHSSSHAYLRFELEVLEAVSPKIFVNPKVVLDGTEAVQPQDGCIFECAYPGIIYNNTYYRFPDCVRRKHLRHLNTLRDVPVPEPLFGTFVENSLPQLSRFGEVANREKIERFVTLPYVGDVAANCDISYLNGELEADLAFVYDDVTVPAASNKLNINHIDPFVTDGGILARNLTEEQRIVRDLFQDFVYDPDQGVFSAKSDKKIVEFMTEVLPRNQERVQFNCPENLLDQFIYDETTFKLKLRESDRVDVYEVALKVDGQLEGVTVDQLWECLSAKRAFIELEKKAKGGRGKAKSTKMHKILVLDLERLAPVVRIFDELGLTTLDNHKELRPLWSLASLDQEMFADLPIDFSMSKKLEAIQQQMLGKKAMKALPIPKVVKADLRSYQEEGVHWLERLRTMHLSGVLADDMGLGKTLQAIVAITQVKEAKPDSVSLVVCPTSLLYNWYEEFYKFNSKLKVLVIDGTPAQRKKLVAKVSKYDVIITSYSLLQKDIAEYKKVAFEYGILDEAQHIKNRTTQNAKSVKLIQAAHRLILTGTPIENSLDELWSLFDYLMPGLLGTYDRFVEKYLRGALQGGGKNMELLRDKVAPFILRRMKEDVLDDLPPVSEIPYYCHLSDEQRKLYKSYADSAREELSQLVAKEGFDRVQIHVLATLTRLKQICCHPAIFAKERPEVGDSAKYDMLMELVQSLIESNHKTVIFSQYTRMLHIMREDFDRLGIRYSYLDGSSKNRMSIVKEFNEDKSISVFLVSLKAGGSGLNLTGADTVIHYDMWWNPAVENQATDRVHRIGQTQAVSAYKLVTMGTIEEKIKELQQRKQGLVKSIVTCDEEAISKLTWEEVLELLQT